MSPESPGGSKGWRLPEGLLDRASRPCRAVPALEVFRERQHTVQAGWRGKYLLHGIHPFVYSGPPRLSEGEACAQPQFLDALAAVMLRGIGGNNHKRQAKAQGLSQGAVPP